MQEDENKVDQEKGDVEEIRSRHADDMTNENMNTKHLCSLSHCAWSSFPHEKNSRCEVWCSHLPSVTVDLIDCERNATATSQKTDCNLYMALNATSFPVLCSSFVVDSLTSFVSITLENE